MSLSLRSTAASDFKTAESDWHAVCGAPSATAEGNGEFSAASDFKTAESDWHAVCEAPSATAEGNGEFSAASDFKRADFLTGVTLGARYEVSASKSRTTIPSGKELQEDSANCNTRLDKKN